MFRVTSLFFGAILRLLRRRQSLLLENLALNPRGEHPAFTANC